MDQAIKRSQDTADNDWRHQGRRQRAGGGAIDVRDAHHRHRRNRRAGASAGQRGRWNRAHRDRQREGNPGAQGNPRADQGRRAVGRFAGELQDRGPGRAARRQDSLQPGPSASYREVEDHPAEGEMAGRCGARQRRRDSHRRQLRIGRAGVPRQVSRRSARGDRRVGRVPLRSDGRVSASTASSSRSRIPIRPR